MVRDLREGTNLFQDLWNSDIPKIAVENPIMHKYAKEKGLKTTSITIRRSNPWHSGDDPEGPGIIVSKATCLWFKREFTIPSSPQVL